MQSKLADIVFFDGHCGLCHGTVRFVLAADVRGVFRFAPLQSVTFKNAFSADQRSEFPDTMVTCTTDGQGLIFSSGIVYILKRLGGIWKVIGVVLWLIPPFLRDAGYRCVAAIRHRLFKRPPELCPLVPPHLQDRFITD
jgi:predicted DCC family thiol-disulfide oxidoreductase YuxK